MAVIEDKDVGHGLEREGSVGGAVIIRTRLTCPSGPTLTVRHHIRLLLRFFWHVLRRFHQDKSLQLASSLTFTTLLSLIPLVTIALTLISAYPVFASLVEQLQLFVLQNLLPEISAKMISRYVEQFSARAGRLTALGLSPAAGFRNSAGRRGSDGGVRRVLRWARVPGVRLPPQSGHELDNHAGCALWYCAPPGAVMLLRPFLA